MECKINVSKLCVPGFSLIELLVTIAVAGALLGIAVPSYRNYATRSQIVETINFLSGYRTNIAAYYDQTGSLPNSDINYSKPSYIDTLVWNASDASIQATFGATAPEALVGGVLLLRPNVDPKGVINWSCESLVANPIKCKYLAKECQTNCDAS